MELEIKLPDPLLDELARRVAEWVAASIKPAREPKPTDPIMTAEDLQEYLHVTRQWLYERVSLNEIPFFKAGKYLRFKRSEIDDWIKSNSTPAAKPLSRRMALVRRGGAGD